MMEPTNLDDTQPTPAYEPGLRPPPPLLLYGVLALFMFGIIGALSAVIVFREVLEPAQQQRVMDELPFMEAFLPARPGPDDTLPTSSVVVDDNDAERILTMQIGPGAATTEEPTAAEVTEEPTPEATQDVAATQPVAVAQADTGVAASQPEPTTPPTATLPPTATIRPTEIPSTPVPPPTSAPVQQQVVSARTWPLNHLNTGFSWERQTWNNCGPTNITMALSFYGWTRDQSYAGNRIKPEREDKNVSPVELVRFTEQYTDLNAIYRYGGDLDLMRRLISAGFPVIVERSHMFEGYEWLGHYQTLVGYDDINRTFYIYDSFLGYGEDDTGGAGITETYDEVDAGWREFNRVFIVPYVPGREGELMAILGEERRTLDASAEHAFSVAQEEANRNPNDAFAWFNLGTSLTQLGMYEQASRAYDRAFSLEQLPWRMLWYQFGPFRAYYETGRYDDVLAYVAGNLSDGGGQWVEETHYWQGRALAALGETGRARSSFRRALNINPNFTDASTALDNLG
jgi:tetratricopeptide (TPR) repeat protein